MIRTWLYRAVVVLAGVPGLVGTVARACSPEQPFEPHQGAQLSVAQPPSELFLTNLDTLEKENKRWVCAALAVFLGPFGAHRLYLGTTAKVPVVYGITFGGFYLLVLIDLGHILFTKDLSPFEYNDRVFMWAKPRTELTPP